MIYKILICIASIIYLESFSLAQETLVLDAQYHGWKTIKFSKPVREITRITGSWSACATSSCGHDVDWRYVDYRGYRDRDDICHNRDEFKCWVSGDPYLATYVLDDGVRRKITHLPFRLHKRSKTLRISSNDFQRGREVNSGQLRFHFSYYTTSSIKPSMLEKARDSLNFILKKLYTSKDLDIPELDEIDLDNLPDFILNDPDLLSATKRYLEAKQKLAELNEEKATLEENADNNYEDLEELLDTIDKDLDLEDLEEGFEEDLDWEPNEEEDDYLPESNYYTDRADETLQFLQSLFELGDRRGFITAVYQWRLSQAEILPTMEPLAISSPGEWAAFVAAKNSVDTYISTKLDDKGWFLDSPVDNDTRARVEEISELAGSMGKDLALEIQSLASLTDAQKRFLIGLTMLGPALKAAAQDNSGAMGQLMATVGGFLQAFRSGSICLGQSLALGDAGDFYEVATGLDQCTGAKLTASGRLLSGIGFFAGSARLWRAVGRLMGFNVDVAKTVDHIADIQEAAKRAGVRNVKGFVESATKKFGSIEGLKNFLDIIKKPFPGNGELGAIGFDLSKAIDNMKYPKLWSDTKKKSAVQNAYRHYKDHGKEFPNLNNAIEYVEHAHSFMKSPPAGTLTKVRANGDELFYHQVTNTFAVRNAHGAPRTIFKPDDGIEYWNKQQ